MLAKLEIFNRVHPAHEVYTSAEIWDQTEAQTQNWVQYRVEDEVHLLVRDQVAHQVKARIRESL